ncbi:MAG: addiction module protein [Xanthomonadales bacterium]|nr:addiction module protein [Xanthomonadales bacterium]
MPNTLESLQSQVLGLSRADRSRLLDWIVINLDTDPEAEREWAQIAASRDQELESGSVKPVPLEDAIKRLRLQFPG